MWRAGSINFLFNFKISSNNLFNTISSNYKKKWNIIWLNQTKANDSQALVITKFTARKYDLYTLSALSKLSYKLRLASLPEFEEREDGLKGLRKKYGGFNFKTDQMYDNGIKYRVILSNQADATVGFTTDGELTNKNLVILKDDKKFWPSYHVAPVVRSEILMRYPKIANILNKISSRLTDNNLRELNSEVDIQKKEYKAIAQDFLSKERLIKVKNNEK